MSCLYSRLLYILISSFFFFYTKGLNLKKNKMRIKRKFLFSPKMCWLLANNTFAENVVQTVVYLVKSHFRKCHRKLRLASQLQDTKRKQHVCCQASILGY